MEEFGIIKKSSSGSEKLKNNSSKKSFISIPSANEEVKKPLTPIRSLHEEELKDEAFKTSSRKQL